MIKCMLKKEPGKRPKMSQIVKHPLLKDRVAKLEALYPAAAGIDPSLK
jgi:hypothetical protein